MRIRDYLKLCLVTHRQTEPFSLYQNFLREAIKGGVTSIQLREKSSDIVHIQQMAQDLKLFLDPLNIPLIINDHINIAKDIDAAGVHLGQSDLHPSDARAYLGPAKIIGWSIETLEQLEIANHLTCIDYIGISAIFPSQTKTDCKTIWGLDGLKNLSQHSKHPIVAIGGINQKNIYDIFQCGADGAAIVSAIHKHADPKKAAIDLMAEIHRSLKSFL
jgi:thiamine-phosphate pyrophosphorylase